MNYYLLDNKLIGATKLKDANGTESNLYIKDNDLIKVLLPKYRTQKRQITVEKLSGINDERFVVPKYGIADAKGNFLGFGIDYLKNYSTLLKYIKQNYIPLEDRKELCYIINDILNQLFNLGFLFTDIHLENFMIDEKTLSIKSIDLDSSYLTEDLNECAIKLRLEAQKCFFGELCLSLLFNTSVDLTKSSVAQLLEKANDKQKDLINRSFFGAPTLYDFRECIDSFDEDFIELNRRII